VVFGSVAFTICFAESSFLNVVSGDASIAFKIDSVSALKPENLDWSTSVESNSVGGQLNDISSNLKVCVNEIDASKGTIKFAEEQYKRYH
jgi:hypothetical protein